MSNTTRRHFVQTLTASLAAPAVLRVGISKTKKLPLAFSTLGCPKWDWPTITKNAAQWGYAALELRGLLNQMDLPNCPEFSGTRLKQTLQDLAALDLRISDLGASTNMHEPDAAKRAKQMDEAKRFIDLAHEMKAPYVRVFPNALVKGEDKQVTIARIVAGLRELGDHAKGSGVSVCRCGRRAVREDRFGRVELFVEPSLNADLFDVRQQLRRWAKAGLFEEATHGERLRIRRRRW